MNISELEKKIAVSIDASGWFDDEDPAVVFSALLDVGFRRVLVRGGSPHEVARRFHATLVGLLAEGADKSRKFRPHLVGADE